MVVVSVSATSMCRFIQLTSSANNDSDTFIFNQFLPETHVVEFGGNGFTSYISSTTINRGDMNRMLDCLLIDLRHNAISRLERNWFEKHQQLVTLNLDHNQLRKLPTHVFDDLISLKNLSISFNLIEVLEDGIFKCNRKLRFVDFSNNKLARIPSSIFSSLPRLKFASFDGNICIDSAYPDESLEELELQIEARCGERNLKSFILGLTQILEHLRNGNFQSNNTIEGENKTSTAQNSIGNRTEATRPTTQASIVKTTTEHVPEETNFLLVSLFWLIVLIIFILFAILSLTFYVVYKKFIVYQVRSRH